ncbi:hypothetical protein [Amycolatopsis deserti]|uniref:hypothetical protein n=1 Tax=Amycolatopsis deserti TaxID=185696 RepID=UPI00174A5D8C|nr:hypothetical protein [Amycolatopsis deserti]
MNEQWERGCATFHTPLAAMTVDYLRRPSRGTRSTNRQLVFHMLSGHQVARALHRSLDCAADAELAAGMHLTAGQAGAEPDGQDDGVHPLAGAVGPSQCAAVDSGEHAALVGLAGVDRGPVAASVEDEHARRGAQPRADGQDVEPGDGEPEVHVRPSGFWVPTGSACAR